MSEVITSAEFKAKVLESPIPVIVDFFATWCMPCKMLAPILESVAAEAGGSFKIVKIDIDKEPALTNQYDIQTVPTLVFIKGGKMVDQIVGVMPKPVIMEKVRALG